jgi:hypothetical protein
LRLVTWANQGSATAEGWSDDAKRSKDADRAGKGRVAGAVGVAVMTLGEKLEQALTHRPNSVVPAHILERLLGLPTNQMANGADSTWS